MSKQLEYTRPRRGLVAAYGETVRVANDLIGRSVDLTRTELHIASALERTLRERFVGRVSAHSDPLDVGYVTVCVDGVPLHDWLVSELFRAEPRPMTVCPHCGAWSGGIGRFDGCRCRP